MHKLQSLLDQSQGLPSLPEVYIQVSELLEIDDSTPQEIGDALQVDPAMTSRILKMVNSAFYGLPQQVTSIPQAISLLGRQHLNYILMGSVLVGVFCNVDNDAFSMQKFWLHSIKTAIIARHLAMQNALIIDHDALFTAGLLHDIGQLIIASVIPEAMVEIEKLIKENRIESVQAEMQVLGFTHTDVSEALMKKWRLPEMLIQCAKNHHKTEHEGPFANASCITYLANQLSQYVPPIDEEEAQHILNKIPNWEQTKCTVGQICVGWQLAEDQGFEVMTSLGMCDY